VNGAGAAPILFASISAVKRRRTTAAASVSLGVILALVLACASLGAQGVRPIVPDDDTAGAVADDDLALAATDAAPVLTPPTPRRRAVCDDAIPVARAAVTDVFRPPQPRA
jgi:hypothetical protein